MIMYILKSGMLNPFTYMQYAKASNSQRGYYWLQPRFLSNSAIPYKQLSIPVTIAHCCA